jgi:hypothetical protein
VDQYEDFRAPLRKRKEDLLSHFRRNGLLRSSESGGDIPAVPVGGDRIKRLKVGGHFSM